MFCSMFLSDINEKNTTFPHLPPELIHQIARNVPSHRQVCRGWNDAVISNFTTVKCVTGVAEITPALAAKMMTRVEVLILWNYQQDRIILGPRNICNIFNFTYLRHLDCSNGHDLVDFMLA